MSCTEEINKLLDQLRQSILLSAFNGRLTKEWRAQNQSVEPTSTLLARIACERQKIWEEAELDRMNASGQRPKTEKWKEKLKPPESISSEIKLYDIPETWQWISFDEITASSLYGPRFGKDEYHSLGTPTIRTTDMSSSGDITLNETPRVNIKQQQQDHFLLRHGDLLITRTGTIGRVALYNEDIGDAIASAYLIRYRLTKESINLKYILYFLISPFGQSQLINGAKAVAQPNINTKTISTMAVPLPPLDEQKEIANIIERALLKIAPLTKTLNFLKEDLSKLEQSILIKAFCGKLLSQESKNEPAHELLARIKRKQLSQSQKKRLKFVKSKQAKKHSVSLVEIIDSHKHPMSPESLFDASEFDISSIDEFFLELRKEIGKKKIKEIRDSDSNILLGVSK